MIIITGLILNKQLNHYSKFDEPSLRDFYRLQAKYSFTSVDSSYVVKQKIWIYFETVTLSS
jgi:hypothetical protein